MDATTHSTIPFVFSLLLWNFWLTKWVLLISELDNSRSWDTGNVWIICVCIGKRRLHCHFLYAIVTHLETSYGVTSLLQFLPFKGINETHSNNITIAKLSLTHFLIAAKQRNGGITTTMLCCCYTELCNPKKRAEKLRDESTKKNWNYRVHWL